MSRVGDSGRVSLVRQDEKLFEFSAFTRLTPTVRRTCCCNTTVPTTRTSTQGSIDTATFLLCPHRSFLFLQHASSIDIPFTEVDVDSEYDVTCSRALNLAIPHFALF